MNPLKRPLAGALLAIAFAGHCLALEPFAGPILLWPDGAPGETGAIGSETPQADRGDNIVRLENVTKPSLTVYKPPAETDTGTAVIVCPGGGYNILAYNLEGTEVVEWLNSIGVTGILLKYRVPRREGREPWEAPLQDAQRAMSLVRANANEWGIAPDRVGILGFSAGGHLSAALSTNWETRRYDRVDDADDLQRRPDFALLIYPAYLVKGTDVNQLSEELRVRKETPPTILIQTADDGVKVENSVGYYLALKNAGVPVEMHLYPSGGHGYGLRPSENKVSTWPERCRDFLESRGLLEPL